MTKVAMNEIWGILFSLINMVGCLGGGQGEVKGACDGPTLGLGGMYPPNRPTWTPPPQPTLPDLPPPPGQKPSQTPPPSPSVPQRSPPRRLPPPPSPPPPPPRGPSAYFYWAGGRVQKRGDAPPVNEIFLSFFFPTKGSPRLSVAGFSYQQQLTPNRRTLMLNQSIVSERRGNRRSAFFLCSPFLALMTALVTSRFRSLSNAYTCLQTTSSPAPPPTALPPVPPPPQSSCLLFCSGPQPKQSPSTSAL